MLEQVERYINGQMSPDERVQFEQLRKTNPEIDQAVVEHTFFLQQFTHFDEVKKFKNRLNDIHIDLAEKGAIQSTRLKGRAKVIYLVNKYKRTAAIAASIAGITAIALSSLVVSVSPKAPAKEIAQLSRQIDALRRKDQELNNELAQVKNHVATVPGAENPEITYKTGGTGFLISNKGLLATNAHVILNAQNIAVQDNNGKDYAVEVVYMDTQRDLALLKIKDPEFKAPATVPYVIKQQAGELAEPVFTLGYPRNEIVYGEGYLSAKTGFKGDTLTYQIAIAANPGNSGGPILNKNGEVVGILSTKQTSAEGVVFATQAKFIHQALDSLRMRDTAFSKLKLTGAGTLKNLDRTHQVKKIKDYVYMVKVS